MRRPDAATSALAAVLAVALGLRLWSIDHGLPYAFNPDEELHFVPIAVAMFPGSFDPGYFQNPPGFTYLLYAVLKLRFGAGFPFGGSDFAREFANDPEPVYLTARVVVALVGTLVAALAFWAGRRFYDARVGLVAAALVAVAFLPVFYSKQALNDMVTLAPVTVALVGCLLAMERGRLLDWALAGGAVGVATATKYTAGAMLATVLAAAIARVRRPARPRARELLGPATAAVCFAVAFLLLNPYSVLDFSEFARQVGGQSRQAGEAAKLGQEDVPGMLYYAWTLTWGLGWLPAAAAVAGAAIALRSDARRGALLVAFPVVLLLFLGTQARFFARWLLPIYPMLAVLAGLGAVRAAEALAVRPRWRTATVAGVAALLLVQGTVSSVRVNAVLGRTDTRILARAWLERNVPAGARIVVEPFLPEGFLTTDGRTAPPRYRAFPVRRPFQLYERRLRPELVERYRRTGYCWVVVASTQKGRGLKAGLPGARAYYRQLDATSERRAVFSPYRPGARPPEFSFDLSFNYLPAAYERPGPLIEVHRLRRCPGSRAEEGPDRARDEARVLAYDRRLERESDVSFRVRAVAGRAPEPRFAGQR